MLGHLHANSTMTDYAPRRGQDVNRMYSSTQVPIPSYAHGDGLGYLSSDGSVQYSHMSPSYQNYSNSFVPNHNASNTVMCLPTSNSMAMNYQLQPSRSAGMQSQLRAIPHNSYCNNPTQPERHTPQTIRYSTIHDISIADTEDQESSQQETMRSEPIHPPLDGYPKVEDFDDLMQDYVSKLSPKKQDKALIHAKRAANIKAVLIDKKGTAIESAQFRFWVKKMFTLHPNDSSVPARKRKICHENKPVAIREKLFKILTRAHKQCQHGGRDKTSAQVRRVYSWVPKELISRFVKLCPTCQIRRGASRNSPPESEKSMGNYTDTQSHSTGSPGQSRHDSVVNSQSAMHSPIHMSGFSSTFQQQNRWMTPMEQQERTGLRTAKLENVATAMDDMSNDLVYQSASGSHIRNSITGSAEVFTTPDIMQSVGSTTSYYHPGMSELHDYQQPDMRYRYRQEPMYKHQHRLKQERPY